MLWCVCVVSTSEIFGCQHCSLRFEEALRQSVASHVIKKKEETIDREAYSCGGADATNLSTKSGTPQPVIGLLTTMEKPTTQKTFDT